MLCKTKCMNCRRLPLYPRVHSMKVKDSSLRQARKRCQPSPSPPVTTSAFPITSTKRHQVLRIIDSSSSKEELPPHSTFLVVLATPAPSTTTTSLINDWELQWACLLSMLKLEVGSCSRSPSPASKLVLATSHPSPATSGSTFSSPVLSLLEPKPPVMTSPVVVQPFPRMSSPPPPPSFCLSC